MKKLFILVILFAIGPLALAQDANQVDKTQNTGQRIEKVTSVTTKKTDDKKQLTAAQQAKIARKQASKERKIQKKINKSKELIKINQKHLELKKGQLEYFLQNKKDNKTENTKNNIESNTKE